MSRTPACLVALLLGACAYLPESFTAKEESLQVVTIETIPGSLFMSADVPGATCTLRNDKGTWKATTPQTVAVRLTEQPLMVDCVMEGYLPAHSQYDKVCPS